MLFLTLYLTGPRELPVATAGLVAGALRRRAARQLHRRPLRRPVRPPPHAAALLDRVRPGGRGGAVAARGRWRSAAGARPTSPPPPRSPGRSRRSRSAAATGVRGRDRAGRLQRGLRHRPAARARCSPASYDALFVVDGLMTLAVRFAVAPCLPRHESHAHATPTPPGCGERAGRPRAHALLPAVVLVDVVYRQLYATCRCTCATRASRWRSTPRWSRSAPG